MSINRSIADLLRSHSTIPTAAAPGKNLVQNGSMAVAHRAPQTGLGASTAYTQVDRFKLFCSGTAARVTADQAAAGGVTGQGNALKVDVTTADASVASGDIMSIKHIIEAQNCQLLRYGDSTAKDVTLSFWMKSPKTGTHCVSLYQSDTGRGYIKEFTIASANTWEQFKITFPGDTGGAGINDDTGSGLNIDWPLICGTGEQGSADSWLASGKTATSNQQNLTDNTSNDVYLTGVQLELDSATDFEHEGYGTTLRKARRYYWEFLTATDAGIATCKNYSTTIAHGTIWHPGMRATPTLTVSDATDFKVNIHGSSVHCTGMAIQWNTEDLSTIAATVASGLTAGYAGSIMFDGSGTRSFALIAEL